MVETREVMDIREASEYLGISRETLYKYVYEERIPAFKLGNRWRFKKTVLDRWMERQSTQREERAGGNSAPRCDRERPHVWHGKTEGTDWLGHWLEFDQGCRAEAEGR